MVVVGPHTHGRARAFSWQADEADLRLPHRLGRPSRRNHRSTSMTQAWLRHRPARVPAWMVDAGWAVAVAVAVTIAIRVAREPGARPPDLLAYTLRATIGALLLARRRWPVAVLVASFATLQVYYVLGYPAISATLLWRSPCTPPGSPGTCAGRCWSPPWSSAERSASGSSWIKNRCCCWCSATWCGTPRCGWRSCCSATPCRAVAP
jgi:hypothetical protein